MNAAPDQLRAYVEFADQIEANRQIILDRHFADCGAQRIVGHLVPKRSITRTIRAPLRNVVSQVDAALWLHMCATLCRSADDFDHDTRKGWTISCRLLGLNWFGARDALVDAITVDIDEAASAWAPHLGEPDARYVGWVYRASFGRDSREVKIGFTTKPKQRLAALSRKEGRAVQFEELRPATMLHEWALHQQGRHPIKAEWYPREFAPAFDALSMEAA